MVTAIGLFSGGLDSVLAARLLMEQGIEVIGLTFISPFFGAQKAEAAAKALHIRHVGIDISEPHFELVRKPKYGYGKNMNPCVDCHAFMINRAGQMMNELGCDFIFTGEVLGQRPFSQNRKSLQIVAKLSGYGEYLLRPLCAKFLKMTVPEREGKVDRNLLLDIEGRSRKKQIELARKWGITEFIPSGGGCALTEPNFAFRLKEAFADNPSLSWKEVKYIRAGRQFRLARRVRLVVGKDKKDNATIERIASSGDTLLHIADIPGPFGCIPATDDANIPIHIAASIVARYADVPPGLECRVEVWKTGGKREIISVIPFSQEEADAYALVLDK